MYEPSICILYGIHEGPAMGKRLTSAYERAGYTIVDNPANADIIVAHSGGCLLISKRLKAQLIVLIGVPYSPGQLWVVCTARKVWREWKLYRQQGRLLEWGHKWLNHIRYSLNRRDVIRMAKNRSIYKPWNNRSSQVIIRNRYDAYCTPDVATAPFRGPRTFISLPGEHDDCWSNPQPYVDLIQSLYRPIGGGL